MASSSSGLEPGCFKALARLSHEETAERTKLLCDEAAMDETIAALDEDNVRAPLRRAVTDFCLRLLMIILPKKS